MRRLIAASTPVAALAAMVLLLAAPNHAGITRAAANTTRAPATGERRGPSARAEVTINPALSTVSVPRSFFGLSAEYWALPRYEQQLSTFERVLSLVRVRGDGPMVLRIGGDSADHVYWDAAAPMMPPQAFRLTPAWMWQTRTLVRRMALRLILDLNLVADSPLMAAGWAQAALADLPRGSIAGLEIGNEPDLYHRQSWYRLVMIARQTLHNSVLSNRYSAGMYVRNFRSYARALAEVAPGVPLMGPAVANPARGLRWLSALVAGQRRALGILTAHRYPLSACSKPGSRRYPTIARLLSERTSTGMANSVRAAVALAHDAGLRFRLTEVNSVTCGGRRGVSDTFATALWAPDALFGLLGAGVDGINVHIRPDSFNAPFILSAQGLQARPLLYGLIMFAHALGTGARLVPLQVNAPPRLRLKVWAVRMRGQAMHVLVVDKGNRAVRLELRLRGAGPATVERLLAGSARARSGITLAGQWLGRDGSWQGRHRVETIASVAGRYRLTVPRLSAALVSVHLRR